MSSTWSNPPPVREALPATVAPLVTEDGEAAPCLPLRTLAWGSAGLNGYFDGERIAPNGLLYHPLFSLDLDLNFWLWPAHGLYGFTEADFWTQKPSNEISNPHQGRLDFSKREFDLAVGGAWNYWGACEGRVFGYSLNNLNRGHSPAVPDGFKDGLGLEHRLYLSRDYLYLGTTDYDLPRVAFLSLGYLPTKSLVGGRGDEFTPGAFVRAYLTCGLWGRRCYTYLDSTLLTERSLVLKLLDTEVGVALRPLPGFGGLEVRVGGQEEWDLRDHVVRPVGYVSLRVVF